MAVAGLRRWQSEAIEAWRGNGYRGIVGAVTGGGKTIFALACIRETSPETTLIVVPTVALLDQWWEEATSYFGLRLDDINIITGRAKLARGTINIGVLNTVSKMQPTWTGDRMMLVIDECHKAASSKFSAVLELPADKRLGLSATPERPYDDGLRERLIPSLGEVIYQYTYAEALRDEVIVPFALRNVVFELEEDRATSYAKLTRMIARTISENGPESPEAVSLYLRRARLLNLSPARVEITLRLVAAHRGERILVFHEDVEACTVIHEVLLASGVKAGLYHSGLPARLRAETLADFRQGRSSALVTCRALDEGFDVPETQIGIIAASTATRRQRIQRLGRVLRPAEGKEGAIVYTLVATNPEIERLKTQGARLIGEYDSQITAGQTRVLLAWDRLILPDGRSIVLERQPGGDAAGYAGLQDRVDEHWGNMLKAAAISTLLGVGAELGTSSNDPLVQALRYGTQDTINQTGQQIVRRQLDVPPTLTIRAGYPLRVILTRDLVLEPLGARR